jgi:hypothetical protein
MNQTSTAVRIVLLATALCGLTRVVAAAGEVRPIHERYLAENVTETPDFRQGVVPLLGKLGCNGRACHGSFQGQGGLRLSLFGYDFNADHENLARGEQPRVNPGSPADSLMLQKPLEVVSHGGGHRLTEGSWQHKVLVRWIEAGAKPVGAETPDFVRLEVSPREIVATRRGEVFPLKAVAVWSNGTREDVTPLCRWRTNNDQVATIDDDGVVTSAGPGDSHVVVFYDNGVVPVSVIQPVSSKTGPDYPPVPTPTRIDELVVQKLKKLGMVPSDLCTDAEFLRRVCLDMTGTLPTAAEVEAFLADNAADKRGKKIDELLERPAYAAWWATKFADWTGNNASKLNFNKSGVDAATRSTEWCEWLRTRIARNVPYDQLAEGIILAVSRPEGETYAAYCERMSGYYAKQPQGQFADQPWMTHYWTRRGFLSPDERAMGFAYAFLGLRIQCAQCHKHPFDQWTKDDFDRFKEFFSRARYSQAPGTKGEEQALLEKAGIDPKKLKGNEIAKVIRDHLTKGEVMPFDELFVLKVSARAPKAKKENANEQPRPPVVAGRTARILGGDEIRIAEMSDPRQALMDWLRDEHNPYFARAIVNRIWSGYFNAGIVEPVDDHSLANPPGNEALLSYLATEFRQRGYDMKWLHREIANSDAYQRSWLANDSNQFDERNFARAVPRRLPAEVAYDALQLATMSDLESAKWQWSTKGRAIANPVLNARGAKGADNYALTVFGRSARESNCECDRSTDVSLLQTVFLRNDDNVLTMIGGKGRWVDQILKPGNSAGDNPATPVSQKEGLAQRVAGMTTEQLTKRLVAAGEKGNAAAVTAIQAELAKRTGGEVAAETADATEPFNIRPTNVPQPDLDVRSVIRQAYLRTLGRYPTGAESDRALRNYDESRDAAAGTRDLLWALVNTKEFVINH